MAHSKTVVILGAGASRGAEKVSEQAIKPPLNADFFTQLQRIVENKHQKVIKNTIADVTELFGKNWSLTLEEYFTKIEFFSKALKITGDTRAITSSRLKEAGGNLVQALSAVLETSIPSSCTYHEYIVSLLEKGDSIVSFNYDCLIDTVLKTCGEGKWNPHYGYGFPLQGWTIKGDDAWKPRGKPATNQETIKLLKLHGSVNWQIDQNKKQITIKERLYQQRGQVRFTIIPPEWNKGITEQVVFKRIWEISATTLSKAKNIIVVGYSFGNNDLHSSALFRLAVRKPLERLIIVNPDKESRRLARDALQNGINKHTIIMQYDDLKSFKEANLGVMLNQRVQANQENTNISSAQPIE